MVLSQLGRRLRLADLDEAFLRARDRPVDEEEVLFREDADDAEVLDRHAVPAGAAGHLGAFEDAARVRGLADRARRALAVVLAVPRVVDAAEAVALDDALEAFALRGTDDVDAVPLGEHVPHGDLVAEREVVETGVVPELDEVALRRGAGGLEVALERLRRVLLFLVAEG